MLVVACPCSLGLATPTGVRVGSGVGARRGVLFRNGEALERIASVSAVAMDKTGTLTVGRPTVTAVQVFSGADEITVRALAASLETASNHPLARAVVQAAETLPLPAIEDVYVEDGMGMVGRIGEDTVLLGSDKLLREYGVDLGQEAAALVKSFLDEGRTVVWLARGDRVLGALAVSDAVRPDAEKAVRQLKQRGFRVIMLTGDKSATAHRIAEAVGIDADDVYAELSPREKAARLDDLEKAGEKPAMVGDGVNDAPALARAFVGMAVAGGSDVAAETAEVTLMRPEVSAVLQALRVGRKTMGKIRQNLFWALVYNVAMIPLAAFGVLSPMVAGAAMAASSVTVVSNSLLLNFAGKGDA